jgi:diguanylate cyclase (GGDEF)-like protein
VYEGQALQRSRGIKELRPLQDLPLATQHVSPEHTTEFAAQWMKELEAKALLVRDQNEWIGLVTASACLQNPGALVREVMDPLSDPLDADTSIRAAALALGGRRQEAAPVAANGTIIGVVSFGQIIDELDRSYDPLTGLPWSDRLREWGAKMLENGREITMLFFDLNDFGKYNKRHGHIVGDHVLNAFVDHVSRFVHPSRDVFVRYGGDEFALVSLRSREEAELLAIEISSTKVRVDEVEEPVGFSVGVSGGKRTTERTAVHYSATIDNLIALASRACLADKMKTKVGTPEMLEAHSTTNLLEAVRHLLEARDPAGTLTLQDAVYQLKPSGQRVVTVIAKQTHDGMDSAVVVTRPLGSEVEKELAEVLTRTSSSA